eukprot:COSAG01_NODE_29704_length_631_cov_9.592105_2_plen_137_part_01
MMHSIQYCLYTGDRGVPIPVFPRLCHAVTRCALLRASVFSARLVGGELDRSMAGLHRPFVPYPCQCDWGGGNGTMSSSSSVDGIMRGSVLLRIAVGLRQWSALTRYASSRWRGGGSCWCVCGCCSRREGGERRECGC